MTRTARAAAVVPRLADGRVLVGARTHHARSWPGTLAFPGGACETSDEELPLLNRAPPLGGQVVPRFVRACALRELGEEVGLWRLCRADGRVDEAARDRAAKDLVEGRSLHDVLAHHELVLDDRGLVPLLLWKTWDGRFAVLQFLLDLAGQPEPALSPVAVDELTHVRWALPSELRAGWRSGEIFLIPPIRRVLVELARHERDLSALVEALRMEPNARERARFDLVEGVCVLPARSPTLPPATHTNAILLGAGDALLVDPATPYPDEQDRFDRQLQACLGTNRLQAIVCTHHHQDHIGDVERLAKKHGVPVWAHKETASRVGVPVGRLLEDGDVLVCPADRAGEPERRFRVVFTPGHAPGHVCLFEEQTRVLIAGDMVAGIGSILIDPPEGHMGTYLASLERLIALEPRALIPAHGPLLVDGANRLREQLAHRAKRQASILAVLEGRTADRAVTIEEIVREVYGADTPPGMWMFAARSVAAALELASERGAVSTDGARFWASAPH
jgi:glyoxylase-like metal-dependent hydrolase (beta-lactamase superfamily II)/8-oxo-dGTP pyrophosphatase MutT (NUDIX family)